MNFFKRISADIPIAMNLEPQTEATPVAQPQAEKNFGIAGNHDQFETTGSTNFDLLIQHPESSPGQPSMNPEKMIDAASFFEVLARREEDLLGQTSEMDDLLSNKEQLSTLLDRFTSNKGQPPDSSNEPFESTFKPMNGIKRLPE